MKGVEARASEADRARAVADTQLALQTQQCSSLQQQLQQEEAVAAQFKNDFTEVPDFFLCFKCGFWCLLCCSFVLCISMYSVAVVLCYAHRR